ncbi:MAG: hypothetical protein ACREMA_05370 [Longimicrobiales bacterium]
MFALSNASGNAPLPLLLLLVLGNSSAAAQAGRGQPVGPSAMQWHEHARSLVITHKLSPQAAGRVYAVMSVAQYGAVVDVNGDGPAERTVPQRGNGPVGQRNEKERGAVAGASRVVLGHFFPEVDAALEQRVRNEEGATTRTLLSSYQRGFEVGKNVGNRMIERAAHLQESVNQAGLSRSVRRDSLSFRHYGGSGSRPASRRVGHHIRSNQGAARRHALIRTTD